MKAVRCAQCIYRAGPYAGYTCDYAAITGHTRKAVPASRCRHFQEGDPVRRPPAETDGGIRRPEAPQKRRKRYDWSQAKPLYDAGKTDKEIARDMGCSYQAVFDWRHREGLLPVTKRK